MSADICLRVLAQQNFLREEINPLLRNIIGLHHYSQLELSYQGAGIVLGWLSICTFYWAVRFLFNSEPLSTVLLLSPLPLPSPSSPCIVATRLSASSFAPTCAR